MTRSVTVSHSIECNSNSIVRLSHICLYLISECGAFGACYWPTQRRMPTYATIRKTRRKENSISVASATSHLHRITPTRRLFTSPRSFPDPRRLDALRRCPCQRNTAIPSYYRGYVATGSSSSCSASLRQHFFLMSVCSL